MTSESDDATFKLLTRWLGNKTGLAKGESREDKTHITTNSSDFNPMVISNLGRCIDFMNEYRAKKRAELGYD